MCRCDDVIVRGEGRGVRGRGDEAIIEFRGSLKSDSCISAINWVSVRWYYTGNQRLIIAAGWQSVILHNELVLYIENIRVYSPRIARSSYMKFRANLKLMHQLN